MLRAFKNAPLILPQEMPSPRLHHQALAKKADKHGGRGKKGGKSMEDERKTFFRGLK
jgi:hypothetical protein